MDGNLMEKQRAPHARLGLLLSWYISDEALPLSPAMEISSHISAWQGLFKGGFISLFSPKRSFSISISFVFLLYFYLFSISILFVCMSCSFPFFLLSFSFFLSFFLSV